MRYYACLEERYSITLIQKKRDSSIEPYELTLWVDYQHDKILTSPLIGLLQKLEGVEAVEVSDVFHKAPGTTIIRVSQARRPQRKWERLLREILFLVKLVCCEKGEGLEEQPKAPYQEP